MATYIERETYRNRLADLESWCQDLRKPGLKQALEMFDEVPAADVTPVVRCKDCEYAERYERTNGTAGYYCGHPKKRFTYGERWDRVFKPVKEANDFCSYGEYQTNMGGVTNE